MIRNGLVLTIFGALAVLLAFGRVDSAAADNVILVTTTADIIADDGFCSLREAVLTANSDVVSNFVGECKKGSSVETDVIQLQAGVTYNLTIAGAGEDAAATGDLDVKSEVFPDMDLIVQAIGNGGTAVIQANGIDRIWHIHGADFTLINIDVTGGAADLGGGLKNEDGKVVVQDSSFFLNSAQSGGALHSKGNNASLKLTNTTISRNQAVSNTGAGIYNETGLLIAIDSNISGNQAFTGGGGLHNNSGSAILTRTRFSSNQTDGCGGGISNHDNGVVTLIDSEVTGINKAKANGGGICNAATMSLTNGTLVYANETNGDGGGIYNAGSMTLRNSMVQNNKAFGLNINTGYGGGIYAIQNSSLDMRQSAVVGNEAAIGGGGVTMDGDMLAFNSNMSHNSGLAVGGMFVRDNGNVTLVNVTMADNEVDGGGFGSGLHVLNGTVAIGNTILANNTQPFTTCTTIGGTITSLGYNLGDDSSCFGEATDIINSDPLLTPLVDGVQSPQAGSPAIDAASALMCSETAVASTDQIDQSRPLFNGCDIGAIEWTGLQVFLPVIVK